MTSERTSKMRLPSAHTFLFVLHGFLQSVLSEFADYEVDTSGPIEINVHPKEQKVRDNDIAMFECETSVLPLPTIYWRRNGRRIDSEGAYATYRTLGGAILRIEPAKVKRDDAFFECVVDDNIRPAASDFGILRVYPESLIPPGYPNIESKPTLRLTEEDSQVLMPCSAEGNPPPKVRWIRDYMRIEVQEQFKYQVVDEGSLHIAYASDDDSGIYECVAENELGVVYSHPVRLIVEED